MTPLQKSLLEYGLNPRDAAVNFKVATEYDKLGQQASSLSFYLRAAELTDDKNIAYNALLRNHINLHKQGRRVELTKNQIRHAIALLPKRPEAYYLYSKFYEHHSCWEDSYTIACMGLDVCDFNLEPLSMTVNYPGYYGLLFQKAVTGWWIGKCDESRALFRHLADTYEMEEQFIVPTINNLRNLGGVLDINTRYQKEQGKELRFKFKNYERVDTNCSRSYQDMFVLSMLDGKENGTYLELGIGHPFINNNTGLLETKFNWKGLSVDKDNSIVSQFKNRRRNTATSTNIESNSLKELLNNSFDTKQIDYLHINWDTPESNFKVLQELPLTDYRFAVVTFRHDNYFDSTRTFKNRSRSLLTSLGYELIAGDISIDKVTSYEDWWVHPDLVSQDIINEMKSTRTSTKKAESYMLDRLNDKIPLSERKPRLNKPQYWKTTEWPTMEFTTSIPAAGCIVDCAFCPQRTLVQSYSGTKMMALDDFKLAVDKLPREVRVTFAGFTEPWLNRNCSDMVLYAHEKGHRVAVFTTGIGMSVEDVKKIKNIPFSPTFPNGGFCLHLPDEERIAKHPISKKYIEVLEYFKSVQHKINNFYVMAMGPVHPDVKHIFPTAHVPEMWSRAGNLLGEAIIKPELEKIKHRFKHMDHGSKKMTCNCPEKLYHNICLPNGDVSLCCMDYGLKYIIGNLFKQDYEDVIPKPLSCFKLCQGCENAIEPHLAT